MHSSPAVANGVVYVGSNRLFALNARTGTKLWIYNTDGPVYSSPAVANGLISVGSVGLARGGGKVYAIGLP